MRFRKDIEALRGISVLLVVLAHAGLSALPGGFVGVDVFFVISGFLITGLLSAELAKDRRIDFWVFYARRVRRLLPALLLVLVASTVAALLLMPPANWVLQAESARWAALWAANVYFSTANFDYFSEGASGSLFLHTWSLGVEEQFYLVWPALIWGAWRLGGVRGISVLCWSVAGAGFVGAVMATSAAPMSAYYQMPFRIWQFALGAAVQVSFGHRRLPVGASLSVRVVGCSMLTAAALCFSPERIVYPGAWAAIPTVGAALLLLHGDGPYRWNLALPRMLGLIGKISYSWYLWHWPALVIGFLVFGKSLATALVASLASLLLAWATWFLVERPSKELKIGNGRSWVLIGLACMAVLVSSATIWSGHGENRARQASLSPLAQTIALPKLYEQSGCDEWFHSDRVVPCNLVRQWSNARPTVVLVGDSIAAQWSPALEDIARKQRWRLVVLTKSSCPMIDHSFVYPPIKRRFLECERWRDGVIAYLKKDPPDLLILGSTAAYSFSPAVWERGTRRLLERMVGASPATIVLAPTPVVPFDALQCAMAENVLGACSVPLARARQGDVIEGLRAGVAGVAGVRMVDLGDEVCPGAICRAERDGILVYRDAQHLNATYVRTLAPALAAQPELRQLSR